MLQGAGNRWSEDNGYGGAIQQASRQPLLDIVFGFWPPVYDRLGRGDDRNIANPTYCDRRGK
jgi:hypothetical protein